MLKEATSPKLKLILGLGLCGLSGVMLYIYFRHKDDYEKTKVAENNSEKSLKDITIKMIVANRCVPLIVGRNGINLKSIEDKAKVKITFREFDSNHQLCEICGTEKCVSYAKSILMKDIQSTIVEEEVYVSYSDYIKIKEKCGEYLHDICGLSEAKVSMESGDYMKKNHLMRIDISGTKAQVNLAKKLIQENIRGDEKLQRNLNEPKSPSNKLKSLSLSPHNTVKDTLPLGRIGDQPIDVYVSAIASPAKFWLQIIGPQSIKLEKLVAEMTIYYSDKENQKYHKITDPYKGQIVAALYKYDDKWYRAEVVRILPSEYNPTDVVLDLYFVDYGDSQYVFPNDVYGLRKDFLSLRFQAVECYLANIQPNLDTNVKNWSQQAISKFEELTQVASCKRLISRVVVYKARREGPPIPGVELYDSSEEVKVNIGRILISHGYAIAYLSVGDDLSSPSNASNHIDCSPTQLQFKKLVTVVSR